MNNAEELINPRINVADLIFPIFSLVLCFFLFLLTLKLRSLTYDYLLCVFISEIINSIGNLLQYAEKDQAGKFLIPFSDIFTMTIFVFFTFSSYEHLIKSNKNIINKIKIFIPISIAFSIVYASILLIIIIVTEEDTKNFYFYENSKLNYIRFIHVGILFILSIYLYYKTILILKFLKEKQISDKANAWKISVLIKTLNRFPIVCILYWLFYILYVFISKVGNYKILFVFKLVAKSFLNLRGFLIALTTIQTNKIQNLIEKIIEVYIKHYIILNICTKRKRTNSRKRKKSTK